MWDLIVSVPDHCLSFYFSYKCALTTFCAKNIFMLIFLSYFLPKIIHVFHRIKDSFSNLSSIHKSLCQGIYN